MYKYVRMYNVIIFILFSSSEELNIGFVTETTINLDDEYTKFLDKSSMPSKEVPALTSIKKEMQYYESYPKSKPQRLELLDKAFRTIKPTSVEPERAFSIMGYFCTKLRNRMSDETLDAMVFLRQHYKDLDFKPKKQ